MKPLYEVAEILQQQIDHIPDLTANTWQSRALYALAVCRTQALGGHVDVCDNPACNHVHISYNSCRNRHCPKCQGNKREEWISKRKVNCLTYLITMWCSPCQQHSIRCACMKRGRFIAFCSRYHGQL